MPELPESASLEYLRKQAKSRRHVQALSLSQAQHELAREYGFDSWPKLVHHVQASRLDGIERALVLADVAALSLVLHADRTAANRDVDGLAPLLVLLRRSAGSAADVRDCARVLLDAGADANSHTIEWGGEGQMSALFDAVERRDLELARLLVAHGATREEDAFYHACEQSRTDFLDLLYAPGFEHTVNHKLDFEDVAGLAWFLDGGVDINANHCLHHAISRGRGLRIITMLLDAGADLNAPWDRWDVGRRPLALAARCGHLAAYELLAARGASAELNGVDLAVLAVARGESVQLPQAPARRSAIRAARTTAGSSGSSRCSVARRSCAACSTPACPSTPAAGATSRRWIRPRCTDGPNGTAADRARRGPPRLRL
ncbi:MAG: ankyrin repeat domain-containing protein [Solirubrobacteraceae bacterium]